MEDQSALNRRTFIKVVGAGVATSLTTHMASASSDPANPELIIDCHAHIYGEDEEKYPTVPDPYRPPPGTGTVAHLKREMQAAGVRHVTVVQTSTFYRWDNRFTMDTARDNKDTMVGICTLNPDDPDSPQLLEEYVQNYNARGMRSIPAESGLLDDPGVDKLWETAERLGIVINVLTNRDKRGEIEALLKRHPALRVVIDHSLNLKAGPELWHTVRDMVVLARLRNVHTKLTFIPTGSAEDYPFEDMHDACRTLIDAFSAKRCVWGSDFPCELWCPKISYAQHLKIFTHELGLDEATKKAVLGETAYRLWFQH